MSKLDEVQSELLKARTSYEFAVAALLGDAEVLDGGAAPALLYQGRAARLADVWRALTRYKTALYRAGLRFPDVGGVGAWPAVALQDDSCPEKGTTGLETASARVEALALLEGFCSADGIVAERDGFGEEVPKLPPTGGPPRCPRCGRIGWSEKCCEVQAP